MILSTIYIITALSLGLDDINGSRTQQVAMLVAIAATLLPTIMMSGFIFPLKSMPVILQYFSYIVPAKYYLIIIRGIMLKGNTLYSTCRTNNISITHHINFISERSTEIQY